jgi:hypothetical protein
MKKINLIKTISAIGIVGITGIAFSATLTSCNKNTYTINEDSIHLTDNDSMPTSDVTWIPNTHTIKTNLETINARINMFFFNWTKGKPYTLC